MAEHIRNEMARAGAAVRPECVMTLAQFLEPSAPLAAAPEPLLHWLIEQALENLRLPRFAAVAQFRGFHGAVAALIEEMPEEMPAGAAGGPFGEDLARLFQQVEAGLAARGMALRRTRLRSCRGADEWPAQTVFDGFFSFSPAELDLIEAMAARASVTVTLPDWPGAAVARRRLLSAGFAEQRQTGIYRKPQQSVFAASSVEREAEEIARRILERHARGRMFREMGIILRVRDPYGPPIETTLHRFGIPVRSYFADPIAAHPAVQYLSGLIRAMLDGWDHAALLSLLRMPISGVGTTPQGDRFDFELRKSLPGAGLPLPTMAGSLAALDRWRHDRLEPADWAAQLKSLPSPIPGPINAERISREQVHMWRSTAAALEAFATALDETAEALAGSGRLALAQFWRQMEVVLAIEPLRVPDRRRDVVHILDVYEARQWELPIVFVCGMVERHFPRYHRENPLFNDAARRRVGLATSGDRQIEERFLYELATTRATAELVLSYARFNDKGEQELPSFFLEGLEAPECGVRVRPKPLREVSLPPSSAIHDPELLERLAQAHKTLAPTSIESFLQCPFQFFAAKTLHLRPRPLAPRDRLDLLVQGSILHRALAEVARLPLLGAAVFDGVFAEEIDHLRIPPGYRTEAVRLELRRHFERFLEDRQLALGWVSRVEEKFSFPLNTSLAITGRIDRIETGPERQALVIDYKYSAGNKIRERIEQSATGNLVQSGLYLLAAARQFDIEPAGMLYCGLRKQVVWDGWHVPIPGLEAIGESTTRAFLDELMQTAAGKAVETFEAIAAGQIAPRPADPDKCVWCDFRDVCRVEAAVERHKTGAGSA